MSKRKKLPDFDKMSEKELRHYILHEIDKDVLKRGDRHALTRACEMWSMEDVLKDLIAMEVDEKKGVVLTRLKLTSVRFVLDLWDKWDRQRANKSSNKRYHGQYRKNDRQNEKDPKRVNKENNPKDKELS